LNWYLFEERYDPGHQIEWLENELNELEKVGGQAIFIAHIPPVDCIHPYGMRIRAIAERYQHVIRFGLYGHTHNERPNLVRSVSDNKNIGINFVAGSVTTETEKNPSFHVLEIDAEFFTITNIQTYYFNVTLANLENRPTWTLLHDYISHYEMRDMSPDGMFKLAQDVLNNEQAALQFMWNIDRRRNERPTACDQGCRLSNYCDIISSEDFEFDACVGQPAIHSAKDIFFNALQDPWLKMN